MSVYKCHAVTVANILPPLPRSLFTRCCNDNNHCTNTKDTGFSEELLAGYIRLRNELIKQLVHTDCRRSKSWTAAA